MPRPIEDIDNEVQTLRDSVALTRIELREAKQDILVLRQTLQAALEREIGLKQELEVLKHPPARRLR